MSSLDEGSQECEFTEAFLSWLEVRRTADGTWIHSHNVSEQDPGPIGWSTAMASTTEVDGVEVGVTHVSVPFSRNISSREFIDSPEHSSRLRI